MTVFVDDAGAQGQRVQLAIDDDGDIRFEFEDSFCEQWIKPADLVRALRELGVLPADEPDPVEHCAEWRAWRESARREVEARSAAQRRWLA